MPLPWLFQNSLASRRTTGLKLEIGDQSLASRRKKLRPRRSAAAMGESCRRELFRGKTVQDADVMPESADSA
jgi:hypothetical protein